MMGSLLEFVKEQYFWEASRRDKLNSASSIPIGAATVAGTIATSVISRISAPYDRADELILAMLFVTLLVGGWFAFNTVRFFLGPIYKYVADAESVRKYWEATKDHFDAHPRAGKLEVEFENYLISTYSLCASINCRNNDAKSRRLYLMNASVLVMVAPCLVAGLVLVVSPIIGS